MLWRHNVLARSIVVPYTSYNIMTSAMASQITGISIVCSTVGSVADQRQRQSSASLAFVGEIHRWPVNSPHRRQVTRKMFPFVDVIMHTGHLGLLHHSIGLFVYMQETLQPLSVNTTYRQTSNISRTKSQMFPLHRSADVFVQSIEARC